MPSVDVGAVDREVLVSGAGVERIGRARRGRRGRRIFARASRSSGEDLPDFPRRFFLGAVGGGLDLHASADTFCRLGKPKTRCLSNSRRGLRSMWAVPRWCLALRLRGERGETDGGSD